MKSATKFTLFGLGIFGLALVIALSTIFIFPLAVWMFKPGFDVMAQGIGMDSFLAKAITLTFALSCAYFLVRFVLTWKGKSRLVGFIGIFGTAIAFNILMHFLSQGKWNKCACEDDLGMMKPCPCAPAEKVRKDANTDSAALGCDQNGEIQERFHSHLTSFGEFENDFLSSRENLDSIPWFNRMGKSCVFYCTNPGAIVSLYVRPGICRNGEKRRAVDKAIQNLLYGKAKERLQTAILQDNKALVRVKQLEKELEKTCAEAEKQARAKGEEFARQLEAVKAELAAKAEAQQKELRYQVEKPKQEIGAVRLVQHTPAQSTPKLKARVVVLNVEYKRRYEHRMFIALFTVSVVEKNGVDVVYNHYTLSIWRRAGSRSEPLKEVKKAKPLVFERDIDDWVVEGGGEAIKKEFDLKYYKDWLYPSDWVEIIFHGRDGNGYPQQIVTADGPS